MREIIFRAWDKKNRLWIKEPDSVLYINYETSTGYGMLHDLSDTGYDWIETSWYTGLKDSQGVEIFEGDIVRFRNMVREEIGSIEFTSGFFGIRYVKGHRIALLNRFDCEGNVTVIGNIYENEDLLGG